MTGRTAGGEPSPGKERFPASAGGWTACLTDGWRAEQIVGETIVGMAMTDGFRDGDRVRVGDAEREACLAALTEHFAQGRLTSDELDQRQRATLRAVTRWDIAGLLSDLPATPTSDPGRAGRSLAAPVGSGSRSRVVVARGRWLAVRAWPAAVLYGGAFVAQGGDSGDWWHLNGDISTGLIMASFGYATHLFASTIRGWRKQRGNGAINGSGLGDGSGAPGLAQGRPSASEVSAGRRSRRLLRVRTDSSHESSEVAAIG